MAKLKWVIFGFVILWAQSASAATYHVAKTGNNSFTCAASTSAANPRLTVAAGLACMSGGDTLIIHAGTYAEDLVNSIPGGSSSGYTRLINNPGDTVTMKPNGTDRLLFINDSRSYIELDGINLDGSLTVYGPVVYGGSGDHFILKNAEIVGTPTAGGCANICGGDWLLLQHLVIHGGGSGTCGYGCANYGFYTGGSNNIIEDSEIYDVDMQGIQIYNGTTSNNIIRNNKIHDITRSGDASPGARFTAILVQGDSNLIYNNIIYNIGDGTVGADNNAAITMYDNATNTVVENNTIYNVDGWGIYNHNQIGTVIRNNIFYLTDTGGVGFPTNASAVDHNSTTNPSFVNAAGGNFQLSSGSSAIDAGVSTVYNTDYTGAGRPSGAAFDLGAYEYAGVPVTPTAELFFVAKDGHDSNSCTQAQNIATAKLTIVSAINCMDSEGDSVAVRTGTYDENITSSVIPALIGTGFGSGGYRIYNYNSEVVTLAPSSGSVALDLYTTEAYLEWDGINIDASGVTNDAVRIGVWSGGNAHHIRIKNLTISGAPQEGIANSGGDGLGGNEIQNVTVHDTGSTDANFAINIGTPSGLVENCLIYNMKGSGILVYNADAGVFTGTVIRNNVIKNGLAGVTYQNYGISVVSGTAVSIYNNVIYNLLGSRGTPAGIRVERPSNVYNNTLYGGAGRGIHVVSGSGSVIRNNIAYLHTTANYTDGGSSTTQDHNTFAADPVFIDAAGGNFELYATSPSIDGGSTIAAVTTDILGNARTAPYNIGAYETSTPLPVPRSVVLHMRFVIKH